MKNHLLLSFALLLFANCENIPKNVEKQPEIWTIQDTTALLHKDMATLSDSPSQENEISEQDIYIKEFGDEFQFHWKGESGMITGFNQKSGICTIKRLSDKKIIAKDSLPISSVFEIEMEQDFNKDGVNDALIYAYSGANLSNSTYNLYVSDIPNKTFHLIKNFEEWPNPEIDSSGMVIFNAVYGSNTDTHFYKIMRNYSIKKIGESVQTQRFFDDTPEEKKQERKDEKAYRKAYNKAWAAFKKMK